MLSNMAERERFVTLLGSIAFTEDGKHTKTEVIRQFLQADNVAEGLGVCWRTMIWMED